MQYTQDHINKRVVYRDAAYDHRPAKYGYLRDVLPITLSGRQMVDFAADGSTRQHSYVWADDCELLTEEHPEYDGPTG